MPRSRDNGSPADVIGRYQRRSPELDEMMVEAYVSGVSQRKMGDVTEALMGERVGRSTVSRVAKRLDEAVEGLRRAPIEGPHPYLYLDATFLGYSAVGIAAEPEFTYIWRVFEGGGVARFGAIRVTLLGTDQSGAALMIFDWAYQLQGGNPQLVTR